MFPVFDIFQTLIFEFLMIFHFLGFSVHFYILTPRTDMKTLDIDRIRLWTENRDKQRGGHAWHLEGIEMVDNSWYKDGIHVSYNFKIYHLNKT